MKEIKHNVPGKNNILLEQERMEAEFKRVTEKQDGRFAKDVPAIFVGGPFNGQKINHALLMAMKCKGYTPRWSQMNGINHSLDYVCLEDQPVIEGYLSPCMDGGYLRYETQEVYDALSH